MKLVINSGHPGTGVALWWQLLAAFCVAALSAQGPLAVH